MPIDYNERALDQAAAVAARFRETLRNARRYVRAGASGADDGVAIVGRDAAAAFDAAMADELGTPAALAVLHGLAGELNAAVSGGRCRSRGGGSSGRQSAGCPRVLGLDTLDPGADAADVPAEVAELAAARERARTGRDFAEADRLRDEIARHGYVVRDTPQGPELVPRDAAT